MPCRRSSSTPSNDAAGRKYPAGSARVTESTKRSFTGSCHVLSVPVASGGAVLTESPPRFITSTATGARPPATLRPPRGHRRFSRAVAASRLHRVERHGLAAARAEPVGHGERGPRHLPRPLERGLPGGVPLDAPDGGGRAGGGGA